MELTKKVIGTVLFLVASQTQGMITLATTYNSATNADSDAIVRFTTNDDGGVIVDPTDPEKPVDPEEPINPNAGELRINYVSDFNFGTLETSGTLITAYAALDSIADAGTGIYRSSPNFISVQDDRGTNEGWKLTVSQSEQLSALSGTETVELAGAKITLKNAQNASTSAFKPTINSGDIELTIDGATQDVATAAEGTGMSTWSIGFGADEVEGRESVQLTVPGESKKVKDIEYKTTLNWNLANTPI